MRLVLLAVMLVAGTAAGGARADHGALARARLAYNEGRYDAAIEAARQARESPEHADPARLVLARALLERFRETGDTADLAAARDTLRTIEPDKLPPSDRSEHIVALGQWLFLTGRFGAAAELFDSALAQSGGASRDRLLDWWASAIDRQAQLVSGDRESLYAEVLSRMQSELRTNPTSAAAAYWLVAAARGLGQFDRAWQAAMAGWVRTALAPERASLRADIDRLVLTAIIPERARVAAATRGDQRQAADTMATEWERFKADWEPSSVPPVPPLPERSSPPE